LNTHLAHYIPTSSQALRAEADGRSLVLLDELGTGTDPVEGAALGVAILRRMVEGTWVCDVCESIVTAKTVC
jgi:DNA mismatch repair protein MutS2